MDAAPQTKKILIIDDNQDFLAILQMMLQAMGYETFTAADGDEGVNKAREIKPDGVFCDLGLPKLDGYQVAAQIRKDQACRHAYMIALTGYANRQDRESSLGCGFDMHLAKPVGLADVKKALQAMARPGPG